MKKKKVRPLGGNDWRLDDSTSAYIKKRISYFFRKLALLILGYKVCTYEDNYFNRICIHGRIYDLDICDEDGNLLEADEDDYCVICNGEGFVKDKGRIEDED